MDLTMTWVQVQLLLTVTKPVRERATTATWLSTDSLTIVVSELGSGIARGFMNLGRLFQGKYIPPERTDGLLPQPDEKVCIEEEAMVEVVGENSCFQAKADIDLD